MSSSQEAGFDVLDEVFENFGPLHVDVDALIDSEFDRAVGGEEEIFCSIPLVKAEDDSKLVFERQDKSRIAVEAAFQNSFEFTYGSNTQVELDGAVSSSPQEETKRSELICSRCREIIDKDGFEGRYSSNKTTTTRDRCTGETTTDPRNVMVTELQLCDVSDDVGTCWREVGPKLHISSSKIHNLDEEYKSNRDKANVLLNLWKQQEGCNATVGQLADVLESIGRKSIAEKLLGESNDLLPRCETVSDGEVISLMVKCHLEAEMDGKLMLCEDTHGNKFIIKAINNSERHWNSEEIQKNKDFLETVAEAAKEMGKSVEQRRQESLKRISSEVQELRQQLKRVKLDCSDAESCAGTCDPIKVTVPSKKDLNDGKMSAQDVIHLLNSCEEQHTFFQDFYNALIQMIGEVPCLGEDNFLCIKQLYEFTRELKGQENKILLPKIDMLHHLKEHLDKPQVAQVEELEKWSRAQKEQVQGVEKLLSSLLHQGKNQKMLKRRSEPLIGAKQPSGFSRRRAKTDASKSSHKWQSLIELPGSDKKPNISGPVCVHKMHCLDTDKKLKSKKS